MTWALSLSYPRWLLRISWDSSLEDGLNLGMKSNLGEGLSLEVGLGLGGSLGITSK